MDNIIKSIQMITVVFAVVAPCLLAAGYGYYVGTLGAYGLDTGLFDRGISEVVTESWFVAIMLLVWIWKHFWWFLGYSVLLFVLASVFFYYVARHKAKGLAFPFLTQDITKEKPGATVLGMTQWAWKCYSEMLGEFFTYVYWPVVGIMLGLLVGVLPFKFAHGEALKIKSAVNDYRCNPPAKVKVKYHCVQLLDFSKSPIELLTEGVMVTSDTKRIAIYSKGKTEVWPLLDKYKIVRSSE